MKRTDENDYEREFAWEVLGYFEEDERDGDALPYRIWRGQDDLGKDTLHVSNPHDQMETIDLRSRPEIEELIARLERARDELFPEPPKALR